MFRRALPLVLALAAASCASNRPHGAAEAKGGESGHARNHPLARITSPDERVRSKAYSDLTEQLNHGPFSVDEVAPYGEDVQRLLDEHLDRVEPAQRDEPITCGSWADRREYVMARWETELLLDVGGSVRGPRMEKSLRRALALTDPRFRYFATRALLQRGDAVEKKVFERIAASDEVRGKLFNLLGQRGRTQDFPAAYATQEALARARMVDWLAWDDGLGCVPRKIELGKVVTIGDDDWFVFRYSVEGSRREDKQPLAGVAGPYQRAEQPTVEAGERTSSRFEGYDAHTPEEHVQAAIEGETKPAGPGGGGTTI
jgi:hypothetical protein